VRRLLVVAVLCLLAGAALLAPATRARPAMAAVVHRSGYEATVLGWTSWYGSYDMGPLGPGWCIDHGLRAPDPALGYRPTTAADLRPDTRAAMAWAVTKYGGGSPDQSVALMLVLHDLRGATYPFGRLDVDTLGPGELSGFAGHEAAVVASARAIKSDAVAHRSRRGPLELSVALTRNASVGVVTATLTDAVGHPQGGVRVQLDLTGATLDGPSWITTDAMGRARARFHDAEGRVVVVATADAIDPSLAAYAPTAAAAQRVAIPRRATVRATAAAAPPPTSTTSTSTSTSTSTTSTTTTSTTSTSTTSTSTTSTTSTTLLSSTTSPPTTTTLLPTTTSPPTTSTTLLPTTAAAVRGPTELPRTGAPTAAWALLGTGLVLLGGALVSLSAGRPPALAPTCPLRPGRRR
jgi:hypothetical protein